MVFGGITVDFGVDFGFCEGVFWGFCVCSGC